MENVFSFHIFKNYKYYKTVQDLVCQKYFILKHHTLNLLQKMRYRILAGYYTSSYSYTLLIHLLCTRSCILDHPRLHVVAILDTAYYFTTKDFTCQWFYQILHTTSSRTALVSCSTKYCKPHRQRLNLLLCQCSTKYCILLH